MLELLEFNYFKKTTYEMKITFRGTAAFMVGELTFLHGELTRDDGTATKIRVMSEVDGSQPHSGLMTEMSVVV